MDFKKFFSGYSGVLQENRFHRVVCVVLLLANLLLGAAVWSREAVVVLVPPDLRERVEVGRDRADLRYQESWGLFFALLLGNVTPKNIDFVVNSIDAYLSPEIYQDLMKEMYAQARNLKQNNVSVSFEPREVSYDEKHDRVVVKGRTVLRGSYGKPQTISKTFEIGIAVRNYYPLITYLASYDRKTGESGEKEGD